MNKTIPLAVIAAVTAFDASSAAHAAGTDHGVKKKAAVKTTPAKPQIFKGPLVDMQWGPVQAVIYVKSAKITKVKIVTNPETNRSLFIDQNAVPMLRQETLQSQNAKIDLISGATMTSAAYQQSLKSAVKLAKKAKALK